MLPYRPLLRAGLLFVIGSLFLANHAATQTPPQRPQRDIVLVIDSGITWGGWSYGRCGEGSDPLNCEWEPLFVPSEWTRLKEALARAIGDPRFVPQDGSVAIAVVQASGGTLSSGTRDWLTGPTVHQPYGIALQTIESASDAAALASKIRALPRFAGPFGQCEPSLDGTACFPFEQFLPGVGLDVAAEHLDTAGTANTSNQTACLVGDVDSGGGWFGFFGSGLPPSRSVGDAHRDGFRNQGRSLRVVDLKEDGGPSFPALTSRSFYEELTTLGSRVSFFESTDRTHFLRQVGACFGPTVEFDGIEVTQAVQRLTETEDERFIELYQGKPTSVRAYFTTPSEEAEEGPHFPVLRGLVNGRELASSPIEVPEEYNAPLRTKRFHTTSSANFTLPRSWTFYNELELVVDGIAADCANDCRKTVSFIPAPGGISMQLLPVLWADGNGGLHGVTARELSDTAERVKAFIPDGFPRLFRGPSISGVSTDGQALNTFAFRGVLESALTLSYFRSALRASWCVENGLESCGQLNDFVSFAVIADYARRPGEKQLLGLRYNDSIAAYIDHPGSKNGWPDRTAEHEIGHLFSLPHAPGGTGSDLCVVPFPIFCPSFPDSRYIFDGYTAQYNVELSKQGNRVLALPWDTFHGRTVDEFPHEVMTYVSPQWVSDLYYAKMRADIERRLNLPFDSIDYQPKSDTIYVRFVQTATGEVFVRAIPTIRGFPPRPPEPGPYELQVYNGAQLIGSTSVEVLPIEQQGTSQPEDRYGIVGIPVDGPISTVVVLEDGIEIARAEASPSAPTLDFVEATVSADTVRLDWQSADVDGDDLLGTILYKRDDGPWVPMAVDVRGNHYVIPFSDLGKAASGEFRVIVTDGLNSATSDSWPIAIPGTPPLMSITLPATGTRFDQATSVSLRAFALDTEDGELEGDSIVWTSDADGVIGTGSHLVISATKLSVGLRELVATATDSDGNAVSDSINVEIRSVLDALGDRSPNARPIQVSPDEWLLSGGVGVVEVGVVNLGSSGFASALLELETTGDIDIVGADGEGWSCAVTTAGYECSYQREVLPLAETAALELSLDVPELPSEETIRPESITARVTIANDRNHADDATSFIFTVLDAPPPSEPVGVTGRVLDAASGVAIQDATVTLRSGPSEQVSYQTGFGGEFSIADVLPGEWLAEVQAAGYPTHLFSLTVHSGGSTNFEFLLDHDLQPATLGGTVLDSVSGLGISGARVELVRSDGSSLVTIAGGSGAFTLASVPPGGYILKAEANGFRPFQTAVALAPNTTFEVEIPLESTALPDVELTGTVVDAGTGEPIGGIVVQVDVPGGSVQAQTNAAGAFGLTLDQSAFSLDRVAVPVVFSGAGYETLSTEVVLVSGATNVINASLVRESPTIITGRIYDKRSSKSLAGARVGLVSGAEIGVAYTDVMGTYRIELDPAEPTPVTSSLVVEIEGYDSETVGVLLAEGSNTVMHVGLDADGPVNVDIAPTVSGPSDISVGQDGTFSVRLFNIGYSELAPGSGLQVDVTLPAFLSPVLAFGIDWSCQPAPTGLSCIYDGIVLSGNLSAALTVVANATGVMVDQVGNLVVAVDSAAAPTRNEAVHLVRVLAAATPDFSLFLEPANRLIVPGASVSFNVIVLSIDGWTDPVGLMAEGLPPGYSATIDPPTVVPSGTALLTISAPSDALPEAVDIDIVGLSNGVERRTAADVELEFGLIPVCKGSVSGRLTNARTGEPIANKAMRLRIGSSTGGSYVSTDEQGFYRYEDVSVGPNNEPQSYRLGARTSSSHWGTERPITVACDTETVKDIQILPREYATVRGRVVVGALSGSSVEATDTPIEGALVRVYTADRFLPDQERMVWTDSNGEFVVEDATIHSFSLYPTRVSVVGDGYWSEGRVLDVQGGDEVDVTIPLLPKCTGGVQVRAVNVDTGQPVPNLQIRFTGPYVLTDAAGKAQFLDIDLGTRNTPKTLAISLWGHELGPNYSVSAPAVWFELTRCGEVVSVDMPVTITFVPPPPEPVRVTGTITDAQTGEFLPLASIYIGGQWVSSGIDGVFLVEVAPDDYQVSVLKSGFETQRVSIEVSEPGPVVVDVALQPNLGYVSGTVYDRFTGEPVPDVEVLLPGYASIGSEDDGTYLLPVPLRRSSPEQPFEELLDEQLRLRAPGYFNAIVDGVGPIRWGETLHRDLEMIPIPDCAPATIRGSVVNAETGEVIEGAEVSSGNLRTDTDIDGRFELQVSINSTFRWGSARVTADKFGFITATKDVTVWCGATVTVDFGEPVTGTTSISGTVTRADTGAPVAGAFVGAEFGLGATTMADGSYLIVGAPLGPSDESREWIVSVDPPGPSGLLGTSTTVVVSEGNETLADFTLSVFGVGDQCPDDPDKIEPGACGCGVPDADADEDGVPDCNDDCIDNLEFDNDGDGIGDVCDSDDDNDGVVDTADNCALMANSEQADNELDGIGDVCDPDDDNDGVPDDAPDNCPFTANPDQADFDMDSLGDVCDGDVDGDLVDDGVDICPFDPDPGQENTDGDLEGDACDEDDDNDGVLDVDDNCTTLVNADQMDTDSDHLGDACDADDDGDNIDDLGDNCPLTPNLGQSDNDMDLVGDVCDADDDNDGINDGSDNCPLVENLSQSDNDVDGLGDACDADDDNDGVADLADNCPLSANSDQQDTDGDGPGDACDDDDDNDGVIDAADNCQFTANPDQSDSDWDGLGDVCDDDVDGDGVLNAFDNCPDLPNAEQTDLDGDGLGNGCDEDLDGDDVPNAEDNCVFTFNPSQTDHEGDGLGDVCDDDDDNDGVTDGVDNCGLLANPDQADFDGDGAGDVCDNDLDGDAVLGNDDVCQFTPVGALVEPATGCSIPQLCPCEGPQGSSEPWTNHGKYVSCVTKAANGFRDQGLISEEEEGHITSEAALSDCGK